MRWRERWCARVCLLVHARGLSCHSFTTTVTPLKSTLDLAPLPSPNDIHRRILWSPLRGSFS